MSQWRRTRAHNLHHQRQKAVSASVPGHGHIWQKVSAALVKRRLAGPEKPPRASFAGSATPFEKKRRGGQGVDITERATLLYSMECRFHIKAKQRKKFDVRHPGSTGVKLRRDRHSTPQNECHAKTIFLNHLQ